MPKSAKVKEGGNRCVTMIAYLNDVQDGGGTVFPVLGFAVQAVQGRVIMFGGTNMNTALKLTRLGDRSKGLILPAISHRN